MRQRGEDVFFLTGTDEHGEPVELAAEREGVSPQELADRNAPKFEDMMRLVEASNDFFIRTSDPRHTDRVAEIMQRMYVWFDALLNYVTALAFARDGEDLTERYWPADLQVMAKDILRFHAVIWPALLRAADMEYPRRLAIHGFLLMGEKKMSKSLGNVIDPVQVVEQFGADALRHYCFREVSFGHDGAVSAAGFEERYEAELPNAWGNLASRTLGMVGRYRDGVVPAAEPAAALLEGDDGFDRLVPRVQELLDRAELTQALAEVWKRVRRLNRYVEESRPWDLAKDEAQSQQEPDRPLAGDRLDVALYSLAEGTRVLALLLYPYMPSTSSHLLDALGEGGRELSELGS